jgi:gliding motility-associated lipoprotein GldH
MDGMNIRHFFLLVLISISFSCSKEKVILEKEVDVKESIGWIFNDSLSVDFSISDTNRLYAMRLQLNHTPDFDFENVYTRIHTLFPDGKLSPQILSLALTNETGAWAGKCNKTDCKVEIALQEQIIFPAKGNYKITIAQFMRTDTLSGIGNIRFLLLDTGERKYPTK